MERTLLAVCLLLCLPALPSGSLQKLPAPRNVKIESHNLKQLLMWDPPNTEHWKEATVTYTVQYKTLWRNVSWTTINCTDATETECDFTNAVSFSWRVVLRVQANLGTLKSDWAESAEFQATRDTNVGPVASLKVEPEYGSLFVSYSAPFNGTPYDWNLEYKLCYWKEKTPKGKICYDTKKTIHTLQDVEPWTVYCLEVEPMYQTVERKMYGASSDVICQATEASAATTAGHIALILFLSMFAVFAVGLGCVFFIHRFHKDIKHWVNPPFRIPLHIEEYLHDNSPSAFDQKLEPEGNEEDHWDKLSFVSNEENI